MAKNRKYHSLNEPLRHAAHKRPVTRRDFLAQGFLTGAGIVTGPTLFSLFANPRAAQAALAPDISALKTGCGLDTLGGGKIPFICFDLSGGANMAGSNVLVGGEGGWEADPLTAAGYSKMGIPGGMVPGVAEIAPSETGTSDGFYADRTLGLAFHADSAYLRGILNKIDIANTAPGINGAVIPARSDNDTANNPHNPMYGIYKAGANGELLTLIGSRNSDSGGNSIAPAALVDPKVRPTKVDRPSDVTGLVDTGKLVGLLSQNDAVAVMESIQRISAMKMRKMDTKLAVTPDEVVQDLVKCGYVKSADLVDRFGNPASLNPAIDLDIVDNPDATANPTAIKGIFTQAEFDNDAEFRKAASVMKLVINGYAGAGTIQMGGFDYHTGDRATGEQRDFRAGQCMGACLEYAKRVGVPLMIYVFSDGSLASNGSVDGTTNGRGKGVWTGDNSSTAASFFLVYNPGGAPQLLGADDVAKAKHQQLGWFRADGSVDTGSTPAANNVNLLVETVLLNYMALHGEQGNFASLFPKHGLGNTTMMDSLTAFDKIVDGTI